MAHAYGVTDSKLRLSKKFNNYLFGNYGYTLYKKYHEIS